MVIDFDKPFWARGDYPTYYQNGSVATQVTNPWYSSENKAAPFDQGEFSPSIFAFSLPPIVRHKDERR